MTKNNGKHLPQIEWFYDEDICGSIFPFIGMADLKTLIEWRTSKVNANSVIGYNKDARNTYFQHIDCIEECIKILFSNPTPEFALHELEKIRQLKESEIKVNQTEAAEFFGCLSDKDKVEFLKLQEKYIR